MSSPGLYKILQWTAESSDEWTTEMDFEYHIRIERQNTYIVF